MEVQHTRRSDTGLDCVVYSYLLKRGCSEERHYGIESVKKNQMSRLTIKVINTPSLALLQVFEQQK